MYNLFRLLILFTSLFFKILIAFKYFYFIISSFNKKREYMPKNNKILKIDESSQRFLPEHIKSGKREKDLEILEKIISEQRLVIEKDESIEPSEFLENLSKEDYDEFYKRKQRLPK